MSVFWNFIEQNHTAELEDFIIQNNIDRGLKDQFGLSPIHYALSKASLESTKVLINNSFDLNVQDSKGQAPLHYCAFYGYADIASLLIKQGASVNQADHYGNHPLWVAVFNDKGFGRRIDIIKLLLDNDADKNHLNQVGISPKDFALKAQYEEVLKLF